MNNKYLTVMLDSLNDRALELSFGLFEEEGSVEHVYKLLELVRTMQHYLAVSDSEQCVMDDVRELDLAAMRDVLDKETKAFAAAVSEHYTK